MVVVGLLSWDCISDPGQTHPPIAEFLYIFCLFLVQLLQALGQEMKRQTAYRRVKRKR